MSTMKKRYWTLLFVLGFASFLCFCTPSLHAYREWLLFLCLFGIALIVQKKGVGQRKFKDIPLLDALQEGVITLDWEGKVLQVNQKGAHYLKEEKGRLIGTLLFNHPLLKSHYQNFHRIRETFIHQSFANEKEGLEGEIKVLEPRKKILVTLLDSSGHYQKKQLGKDFVANASHELRTPITIIKGFAETIYDLPEISSGMLTEFTEKIVRNCQRMDSLVKNLLTLADLDYLPRAKLQECDLVALIDSCSQTLLSLHPEIQIESLHNEEVIIIHGDPDLLELAIMNLLENGVKYSEQAAKITITIEDGSDAVKLTIADQGIGIPEGDLDKIFERFFTVDKAHSRRMGGAGLGLSIVDVIISKHQAKIDVTSTWEKGTTFTLTFQKVSTAFQ
ncbi:ATP-binding protein [Candidatus Neptunochlamydia vexilliferae]|nr:ATP-binding protein [Candidatus Neptunochlamydia vexilliferae]